MKNTKTLLYTLLITFLSHAAIAQSGPWARYDQELKDGALYREASAGNLEEVKSIIAGGGNIHMIMAQTKSTILMAAAGSGKIEVVRYLLSQGADPAAKDWWNQTAIDKARSVGAKDIEQLLQETLRGKQPVIDDKQKELTGKPNIQSKIKEPEKPVLKEQAAQIRNTPTKWPVFGSYNVGDSIIYWVPTGWRRGVIKEVGVSKLSGKISVDFSERKYLIDPDAYALGNDWYEWTGVVTLSRQPFWTAWFAGEWQIGEVMAHNNEVKNGKETDRYYYMDATETLQVNTNGTYQWKLLNGKVVTGKWVAAVNEPGIILKNAYRNFDWTLRNATSVEEWRIRKLDMIELKPSAMVGSIKGKRKTTL